ncbi:MAG: transposase [Haloquadratum walsbyi J07HQW1]|uniref:Transposase n=1 Tax=Haloquadratum walsbyi J07HQW1 TaxID=1238424 RepID=U1N446_9EURY|nr:MAG: transposase [Haloquadratum walsbyi J07HQW1]
MADTRHSGSQKSETSRSATTAPDEADIKEVTIKKETTGKWFVCFGLELETDDADLPEKPDVESLNTTNSVGIDLGILNYIHTTDGKTVDWLDLEDDYERSRREQRKLSRKQKGSNNYEETTARSSEAEAAHPSDSVGLPAQNTDVARP